MISLIQEYGLQLVEPKVGKVIAFHLGGGTREDCKKWWKNVYNVCTPLIIYTDGNYSYTNVISKHKTVS